MTESLASGHWLAGRLYGRLYYGWAIVGVVLAANLVAFGISPVFGLFITPLEQEFGWDRATISRSLTLGTIMGAMLAPALGYVLDRLGARLLMSVFGLCSTLFFLALSQVQQAWQFNLFYGLVLAFSWTGVGQIMGTISINRWFVRRRGRAMGIVMMGASGGAMLFIPLCTLLIATAGWRVTYMALGAATLLMITVPTALLMVNRPQAAGLSGHEELNAHVSGEAAAGQRTGNGESGWRLREAAGTSTFWLTLVGVMLVSISVQGYFVHAIPHMETLGVTRAMASTTWGVFFLTGVFAKLGWGFVVERIGVRRALIALSLGEACGLLVLLNASSPALLIFYAVFNGIAHGPFLQLLAMVWADYFGRQHIGKIYGTVQPAVVVAASTGPWVAGHLFDLSGNYRLFFSMSIGFCLVAAVCFLLGRPPGPPRLPSPALEPNTGATAP